MPDPRTLCAFVAFAALAGPASANPLDSLRWRVEDAIADTAARKVEAALSGEGRKAKEKPAKPAPLSPPPAAVAAPAPPPPAPVAPPPVPAPGPAPLPAR